MAEYINTIITGAFGLLVVWLELRMTHDRKRTEKRATRRAEESRLSMRMMDASLELAFATALAVENHTLNGEMKSAKQKAKDAHDEYEAFIQTLASEQATKI